MCTVSISEQEALQIGAATVTILSVAVAGTVRTSKTLVPNVADAYGYAYNLKT